MKLTFLGTAASEGYPNAFCGCVNCERSRELGGRNLRMRSAALIDDLMLIDFGPDLMASSMINQISLTGIQFCLLTHEHADHLDGSHFSSRSPACSVVGAACLELIASTGALQKAADLQHRSLPEGGFLNPEIQERLNLRARSIDAGETMCAGPYRITAIPATHDPERISPHLYAIERDGRTLFYATDTGPLAEMAFDVLRDWAGTFNVVVLDHTFGMGGRSTGHLNADQFVETIDRLRDEGRLAADCRVFAHHIAHHSNPVHETLVAYARTRGYDVAFDGLTVDI